MSNGHAATWQFPPNEAGKVFGWSDDASPSNPNASLALVNRSVSEGPVQFRTFSNVNEASGSNIPPVIDEVQILNYATVGDGGGARYIRAASEPTHAGKFQSANGVWWELAESRPNAKMFGAVGDGSANDTTAMQAAFSYIAAIGGVLDIPAGTYKTTAQLGIASAAQPFTIKGAGRDNTEIVRGGNSGSVISLNTSDNWTIEDLSVDAAFSTFPTNANHGIVWFDCSHVRVRRVFVKDWRQSAIIGYVSSPTTSPVYEDNVIEDCDCDGLDGANNGLILVDAARSGIRNSNARNIGKSGSPCYALQVKNGGQDCFIENSYGSGASIGVAIGNNDVVNSLALRTRVNGVNVFDCDVGVGLGNNNLVVGTNINIDMNGTGQSAIDFQGGTTRSVFQGVRVNGLATSRPAVRFRSGDENNSVHIGVAGRASGSGAFVEFFAGSLNNYARIDVIEGGATDSNALVTDLSTGSTNVFEYSRLPNRQNATIASDAITLRHGKISHVRLETEAAAATDDLVTINGGVDGQLITLCTTNGARDVVVKNGTGNIRLNGGADFTLDSVADTVTLMYSTTLSAWLETGRGNNL